MIAEAVHAAYAAYTAKHGREPDLLRCSQDVFAAIQHELHCDWGGGDWRYLAAAVVVGEKEGFEFSNEGEGGL